MDIRCFLEKCFPQTVYEFRIFNEMREVSKFEKMKQYLLTLAENVKYTFGIWDFSITPVEFIELIETYHNIDHLDMYRSSFLEFNEEIKIDKEVIFKIKGIDFRCSNGLTLSKMEVLVKEMAKNPTLIKCLQYVWIAGTKLQVGKVQMLFTQNKFNVIIC
jgi:hypothetical protein